MTAMDEPKDVPGYLFMLQQERSHRLEGSVLQASVADQGREEWSFVGSKQLQPYEKRAAHIRLAYEEAMRQYQAEQFLWEERSNADGEEEDAQQ